MDISTLNGKYRLNITPEILDAVNNDPVARISICEEYKLIFAMYYFPNSFDRAFAEFQYDIWNILDNKIWEEAILIGFRESGKTLMAFVDFIHGIVYRKFHFGGILSVDGKKASNHTYNIAVQLQTNKRLIADFGQLYFDEEKKKHSKKKTVDDFITTNYVRVKAFSNRSKFKGETFIDPSSNTQYRPDKLMCDDIETTATAKSYVVSQSTIDTIEEALTSMPTGSQVIYCCNRDSTTQVVAFLENRVNNKTIIKYEVKLLKIDKDVHDKDNLLELAKRPNAINWASKFVATDKQKDLLNKFARNKRQLYESIENLLIKYKTVTFLKYYQNTPMDDMEVFVQKNWIKDNYYTQLIPNLKYCIYIDPQSGMSAKSDEFAITVVGYEWLNPHRFVVEQITGRASPIQQAKLFILAMINYGDNVELGGVEVIKTQTAVYQNILEWRNGLLSIKGLPKCKKEIPIVKYTNPKKEDKDTRLNRWLPAFERGEIHLPSPSRDDNMYELEEQLIYYTNLPHDDRADSLVGCLDLTMRTKGNIYHERKKVYNKEEGRLRPYNSMREDPDSSIVGNIFNQDF